MTTAPVLRVDEPRAPVRAVALVLHGGRSTSTAPVTARQLAVVRMNPFAARLRRDGAAHGLAVARLRYRVRGWNGDDKSPVADTQWALDELGQRFSDAPVALVGHSMGGRAALYVAGHPNVEAVVALAPWIERDDPIDQLAGRRLLVVHGAADRITSAKGSAAYARHAATVAASVSYVRVENDAHAMLRRARLWHEITSGFVLGVLFNSVPDETGNTDATNVLEKALAGEPSLVV